MHWVYWHCRLFFVDGTAPQPAGVVIWPPSGLTGQLVLSPCLRLFAPHLFCLPRPPSPPSGTSCADLSNRPIDPQNAGEIINSLRLSEARQLLSRYRKSRKNGAAVAGAGATLSAIDLKGLPLGAVAEGIRGVSAEGEASTAGGAAAAAAAGGSTTAIGVEQKLMTLIEKAVMALSQVSVFLFMCVYCVYVCMCVFFFSCLPANIWLQFA